MSTPLSDHAGDHPGRPTVVKLGGSLFGLSDLPWRWGRLRELLGSPLLVVPGGGGFAEELRRLDRFRHWPDERAHRLGLSAMALSAELLAETLPDCVRITQLGDQSWDGNSPRTRILAPAALQEIADLPASWDVTSDSIAARIAIAVQAPALVLVKSVDLVDEAFSLHAAADYGYVDRYFPQAGRDAVNSGAALIWVNLRGDEIALKKWHPDDCALSR